MPRQRRVAWMCPSRSTCCHGCWVSPNTFSDPVFAHRDAIRMCLSAPFVEPWLDTSTLDPDTVRHHPTLRHQCQSTLDRHSSTLSPTLSPTLRHQCLAILTVEMCAQCQAVSRHFDTPDTPDTRHLRHLRHLRHPRHPRHPAESKMGRTCLTAGPVSWDRCVGRV